MSESFEFNHASDVRGTLSAIKATNKTAVIYLNNGISFEGKVIEIGSSSVILSRLSGRTFSDAFVLINTIVAIEVQVRGT